MSDVRDYDFETYQEQLDKNWCDACCTWVEPTIVTNEFGADDYVCPECGEPLY